MKNLFIIILLLLFYRNLISQKNLFEVESFKKGLKKTKAIPVKKQIPQKTKKMISGKKPVLQPTKKTNTNKQENISTEQNLFTSEFNRIIPEINIKNIELVDLLRGIALEYKLNLVVDKHLNEKVTLTLTNVSIKDLLLFLGKEYNFKIEKINNILKIYPKDKEEEKEKKQISSIIEINVNKEKKKITLNIKNAKIVDVIKKITKKTGYNIIINNNISGKVQGFLQNIDIKKGIILFFKNNGYILREVDNVFYLNYKKRVIKDNKGKQQSIWVNINDKGLISFELIDADIIEVIREISLQLDINLVTYDYPKGKISAKCNNIPVEKALDILLKGTDFTYKKSDNIYIIGNKKINSLVTTKLIKLNHIIADGIIDMIPELVKKNASIKIIKEQNAIVAIGTNDIIAELENFIKQIDSPTPQILIEALVVDYNTNKISDFGVLMGTDKAEADTTSWVNFSKLDLGFNKDGSFYTQQDGNSVNIQLNKITNFIGAKNIGILPDNFYIKLKALQSDGVANVKSRPQIATLNGHTASISIGTTQYYILKSTTPVSSAEQVVTQETERFEKVEANITLAITPWVSTSGEVTVEIHPEFKTPVGSFSSKEPPTINSRVIDSTVRLKDGETIILGGLIEEKDTKIIRKVPILGDIPILGYLFRMKSKRKTKTEMMIYITPHIFFGDKNDRKKWKVLKQKF